MTDTTDPTPGPTPGPVVDDAPLTPEEQTMLADLLARKAAADARAARAAALAQLDGVSNALTTMMGDTCLGVLRAAAGKVWDQDTLQALNRIGAILDVDGDALLATIAALAADPVPAPATA